MLATGRNDNLAASLSVCLQEKVYTQNSTGHRLYKKRDEAVGHLVDYASAEGGGRVDDDSLGQ
mgnify:CR=1 FL=1